MHYEKNALITASLLHDIGKVALRAEKNSRIMDHSDAGYEWANVFIEENTIKNHILEGIKYHHAQKIKNAKLDNESLAYIVYEADNIAAGIDRRDKESEGENKEKGYFDKKKLIESVFNVVQTPIKEKNSKKVFDLADTFLWEQQLCLPFEESIGKIASSSIYAEIYSKMTKQFEENGIDFYDSSYINSLLNVLESLLSFVPSSTNTSEVSDISLFDHLQLTAAVASCIYDCMAEKGDRDYKRACFDNPEITRSENTFLMVHGDLSGIQDFIYTISTKNALKTLRGRSFFLEILVEHVVDEILEAMELSRANLLYTGGGGFYMLLPNTDKARSCVEKAKESLNRWLYSEYGTLLYVEMAYSEACSNDFMYREGKPSSTSNCFKRVSDKISAGKLSRYSKEHLEEIFTINTPQDTNRECGICGTSKELVDWEDEGKAICKGCRSLVKMGEKLVHRYDDVMVICVIKSFDGKGIKLPEIFGEGSFTLIFDSLENVRSKLENSSIKRVYSKNKMIAGFKGASRIFAADYSWCTESKENKPVEFEKLVNDAKGIKRLGVFRADVDNLGQLFSKGFRMGEDASVFQTLGRYVSISKSLTKFFKDSINKIAGNEEYKRSLAIVYSGGDDVFAVGPWNQVIEFARDLRKTFEEFTCGALSFSAGIGFYEHKYPISRMADETGSLENFSKSIDKSKDRIALFGMEGNGGKTVCNHVYTWKAFDRVLEKTDFLYNYLHEDKNPTIGKSKLYKYLKIIKESENNEGISIARFAYTLGRQCPGTNAQKEDIDKYNLFKNNLYSWITDKNERKELATAIQLAVYKIRNEGGDING